MPLYLDISPAIHAKAGLSRYADSLAQALISKAPDRFAFFFNRSGESQSLAWLNGHCVRSVRAGYKPWRMTVWLGQLLHIGFDRLVPGCRLFHAMEHLLLPLRGCPTVLTVHDLIFRLLPEHHTRLNRWYLNAALPLYCRRAAAIICVSQHTKSDLIRIWDIDPTRVHVIYEAADSRFQPVPSDRVVAVRQRYGLPERYLLTVGTIEPRKNLIGLLDAVSLLRRNGNKVNLVIVGQKGWLYEGFFAKLEQSEYRDAVVDLGFVPDSDLPAVYAGAALTVLPSFYEGFGLPILESFACGTPVASSHAASMPEVGGGAARYFDPGNVIDMAAVIGQMWNDAELREHLSEQGLTRAAEFSWKRAADETVKLYEKLGVEVT